jgi:hypothetical protein
LAAAPIETTTFDNNGYNSPDFSNSELYNNLESPTVETRAESERPVVYELEAQPVTRDPDPVTMAQEPAQVLPSAAAKATTLAQFYKAVTPDTPMPGRSARAELATSLGLNGKAYKGTGTQNSTLLCYLKGGTRQACGTF